MDPTLQDLELATGFYKLKPGDIVTLREPYQGFNRGIVVEIIATERSRHYGGQVGPRNVSLHLFNDQGQIYLIQPGKSHIPTYVDFHISELVLSVIAGRQPPGHLVQNPPAWRFDSEN